MTTNNLRRSEEFHGLVLTDLSLRVTAFDRGAASILAGNGHSGQGTRGCLLPAEVSAQLSSLVGAELPDCSVSFTSGRHIYVCRVTVLHCSDEQGGEPMLAFHMYRDTDVQEAISQFASEYDLTPRERQTLLGIASGLTCKEIADQMNISPNTVKSFLRLLMIKIGVTRRGGIISKILDHHRHGNPDTHLQSTQS